MKKAVILAIFLMLLAGSVCAAKQQEVLNTDIKAYVDGHPIRSFNIEGWTGIIAEDLMDYGFTVTWDGNTRTLLVEKGALGGDISSTYQFAENTVPVGSHAAYVYDTDIKTFVDKNPVMAFNIGGQTIIYIDELAAFGDVVWDGEKREISYSSQQPWQIGFNLPVSDVQHTEGDGIKGLTGAIKKNESGEFITSGENLEHLSWAVLSFNKSYGGLQLGFSMAARHLFADTEFTELCSNICTVDYDGARLREDAQLANRHAKVLINGQPVKITNVRKERGNNHLDFIFELASDIKKEEITELSFEICVNAGE